MEQTLEAPGTSLTLPERAAVALESRKTEQHLTALATKHASITVVKDKAGREQAHGAYMEVMRARTAVEKAAKEAREDATKFSKAVITEAARLVAIVEPEETRLKEARDAWDAEQARLKAEAEATERARVLAITERIAQIKSYATLATQCRTAERVQSLIEKLAAYDLSGFDEFDGEAAQAHANTIAAMGAQRQAMADREAEAAALKAEQEAEAARLKAEREALAKQQAEAAEAAAAERAKLDAEIAAERAKAAAYAQRVAEEARAQAAEVAAERAELARQQAVFAAQQAEQKVREAAEAMSLQQADAERAAPTPAPTPEPAPAPEPATEPEPIPTAMELVKAIALEWATDQKTAATWIQARAEEVHAIANKT